MTDKVNGTLTIDGLGSINFRDRKSIEIALDMLHYLIRDEVKLRYYCEGCKKENLKEYYVINHYNEVEIGFYTGWQNLKVYCKECAKVRNLLQMLEEK